MSNLFVIVLQYLLNLGISSKWKIVDVFGLDDELLPMIPQPTAALILLFPANKKNSEFRTKQVEQIQSSGQTLDDSLYFCCQTIRNACGTIALLHSIANNTDKIELDADKPLKKFLNLTMKMSSVERGAALEKDENICAVHEACAQEGQTEAPDREESVNLHFIAFVQKEGHLYEFDGNRPFPVNHGPSDSETFLKDAAKVCKEYMSRDPTEVRFTVMALTAGDAM
ncbi:Ubiquitin carboxyl-terminal hydrolase isozyme L3 [Nymphon striatum]|nr:Ubiquitin carboxyl-terminal hydrolase isozyme L3 [Nymphon striatum]